MMRSSLRCVQRTRGCIVRPLTARVFVPKRDRSTSCSSSTETRVVPAWKAIATQRQISLSTIYEKSILICLGSFVLCKRYLFFCFLHLYWVTHWIGSSRTKKEISSLDPTLWKLICPVCTKPNVITVVSCTACSFELRWASWWRFLDMILMNTRPEDVDAVDPNPFRPIIEGKVMIFFLSF